MRPTCQWRRTPDTPLRTAAARNRSRAIRPPPRWAWRWREAGDAVAESHASGAERHRHEQLRPPPPARPGGGSCSPSAGYPRRRATPREPLGQRVCFKKKKKRTTEACIDLH